MLMSLVKLFGLAFMSAVLGALALHQTLVHEFSTADWFVVGVVFLIGIFLIMSTAWLKGGSQKVDLVMMAAVYLCSLPISSGLLPRLPLAAQATFWPTFLTVAALGVVVFSAMMYIYWFAKSLFTLPVAE